MGLEQAWLAFEPACAAFLVKNAELRSLVEMSPSLPTALVGAHRAATVCAAEIAEERRSFADLMIRTAVGRATPEEHERAFFRLRALAERMLEHEERIDASFAELASGSA